MRTQRKGWLYALALPLVAGCLDRPVQRVSPNIQSGFSIEQPNTAIDTVDLLVVVDNSGSMERNQQLLFAQLRPMINTLINPPCVSASNPTPHACVANDPNETRVHRPVRDLHVGVVSTDIGTAPGYNITSCSVPNGGDDGILNPLTRGPASMLNDPRRTAPPGYYPPTCRPVAEGTPFLAFRSDGPMPDDPERFATDFVCNAGLYINGCSVEQPLEAAYRALVHHDARSFEGNTSANAGFLRENALLAVVLITDEEDGSVRDCRFADDPVACSNAGMDALDVFNDASPRYAPGHPSLRTYYYQPGNFAYAAGYDPSVPADPMWQLDRYIDPRDPHKGLLGLKCPANAPASKCHPERVIFAAIAGVPKTIPVTNRNETDWNALLGTPGTDPNDFYARDSAAAINTMTPEGPISMRANNPDPNCSGAFAHPAPACRRGNTWNPARPYCSQDQQYFALPSRRVVEVARRFQEAPLCKGQPCHNGLITSICDTDYTQAMSSIVDKIRTGLERCLERPLSLRETGVDLVEADCLVRLDLPVGEQCDPARSQRAPAADGSEGPTTVVIDGETRNVCVVNQIPLNRTSYQPDRSVFADGWYYDRTSSGGCSERMKFTQNAEPRADSVVHLECIQALRPTPDGGVLH